MKISRLLLLYLLMSMSSFAQDKTPSPAYASCCGTTPVEFSYDKKKVFVPNVFTPNRDGVNDYFAPLINDEVADVWWFTIYSAEGDSVLYQTMYLERPGEAHKVHGWDGLRSDGTLHKGLFRYKMRIDDREANKHIIEGTACVLICDSESKILRSKEGCFYAAQAGPPGSLDKSAPNLEKPCP